jgi:uncharacterized protein (TIGR02246 family)
MGAPAARAQDTAMAAVRRAIDAQNAAWSEGIKRADVDVLARIFADSGVQVGLARGTIVKGHAAIAERFRQSFSDGRRASEVVVQTDQVILDGPTAVEYGHYGYNYPAVQNLPPIAISGHYVVVWRRQPDGTWKILMDAGIPAP